MEANQEEQKKRFQEVIELLKSRGVNQETIARETNEDATYISRLKSGKVKKIPDKFLEELQKVYDINPDYIRGKSNTVFNSLGTKLKNFEAAVDSWDTVYIGKTPYLHLQMDSVFYDFLVEYDRHRLAELDGISIDAAVEELKAIYKGEPKIEKYVILPENVFIELAGENKEPRKVLTDILNLSASEDTLDE